MQKNMKNTAENHREGHATEMKDGFEACGTLKNSQET